MLKELNGEQDSDFEESKHDEPEKEKKRKSKS